MQTTWKVTTADRDGQGKIRVDEEPRSLADLLPTPASIRADAARVVPQNLSRGEMGALTIVGLVAIFIVFYAWGTPTAAPTPQIERATIMPPTVPPARPTAAPTAAPVRLLAAFDQPAGRVLGTIEETRPYTPTAHSGGDWIQADVAGSGLIWIRAADLPGIALVGPDLATPPPAPQVVYVVQPVQAAPTMPPVYETSYEPPAPAYEPASAPVATVEQVRAEDFKEPDRAATCAFVGCL